MNINWQVASNIGNFMASIVVVLGVPIGLFQYYRTTNKERREQEYSAYDSADSAYLEFLKLCFENPSLDVFDIPDKQTKSLSDEERKQELIAFTMLIAVFQRAFFVYQSAPSTVVSRQWLGWEEYICDYCKRNNFRIAWGITGYQFDDSFQKYMEKVMDQTLSSKHLRADTATPRA